ncbi:hypothetical protein [Neogemmobacter tilapiae]|nr:hypothetical protein [Gemmobacter tilapiae]
MIIAMLANAACVPQEQTASLSADASGLSADAESQEFSALLRALNEPPLRAERREHLAIRLIVSPAYRMFKVNFDENGTARWSYKQMNGGLGYGYGYLQRERTGELSAEQVRDLLAEFDRLKVWDGNVPQSDRSEENVCFDDIYYGFEFASAGQYLSVGRAHCNLMKRRQLVPLLLLLNKAAGNEMVWLPLDE